MIRIAKESRCASYFQTSYSAILKAITFDSEPSLVEKAKWEWSQNFKHEAMSDLQAAINTSLISNTPEALLALAKKNLLLTRWKENSGGLSTSAIIASYLQLTKDQPTY